MMNIVVYALTIITELRQAYNKQRSYTPTVLFYQTGDESYGGKVHTASQEQTTQWSITC